MGVGITYMGTKREIAPIVAEVAKHARDGVFLDAFAGMCTVAESIGPTERQIWVNDAQVFASNVGRALFTSPCSPPSSAVIARVCGDQILTHRKKLTRLFSDALDVEDATLSATTFREFVRHRKQFGLLLESAASARRPTAFNFFTSVYSNNYFGLRQAIEIDAALASITGAQRANDLSDHEARWLRIALGRSLLRVANSPGHFAQYLKPHEQTFRRFTAIRRRSVLNEWHTSIDLLQGVGSREWRKHNRAFNCDSLSLLSGLKSKSKRPAVIYADPPYTSDQYSRYYHILETMMLCDAPGVTGAGLYRTGRFQTSFSRISSAGNAITQLVQSAARLGADLILSYPSNGLARERGFSVYRALRDHYPKVERQRSIRHSHSTFGGSKGTTHAAVLEHVYLAKAA